jgi:hypothetical protein
LNILSLLVVAVEVALLLVLAERAVVGPVGIGVRL